MFSFVGSFFFKEIRSKSASLVVFFKYIYNWGWGEEEVVDDCVLGRGELQAGSPATIALNTFPKFLFRLRD